jgi:hypothetical protein
MSQFTLRRNWWRSCARLDAVFGLAVGGLVIALLLPACGTQTPTTPEPDDNVNENDNTCPLDDGTGDGELVPCDEIYNNMDDPTNNAAAYIGSRACRSCHTDTGVRHNLHGHANILTSIDGQPPDYPFPAIRANVPNPPDTTEWSDIGYVLGGYTRTARFIDAAGYVLTNDQLGVDTQYDLALLPIRLSGGFAPYEDEGAFLEEPKPFDYSCFVCHVTGGAEQDPTSPEFQDNRPGIAGTWVESGVMCEACHGPGGNHIGNPEARDLYVNRSAELCGRCHNYEFASDNLEIRAKDGFLLANGQYAELRASGGHSEFSCIECHNPHAGPNYDRTNSHVAECRDCHADQNLAVHEGLIYVQGDYVEEVTCESCHMPWATLSGSPAPVDLVGEDAQVGDTQSHVFRIRAESVDYTAALNATGDILVRDDEGRAALTVDYVCLRCHHGQGNVFPLTVQSAGVIGADLHVIANGDEE